MYIIMYDIIISELLHFRVMGVHISEVLMYNNSLDKRNRKQLQQPQLWDVGMGKLMKNYKVGRIHLKKLKRKTVAFEK